MSAQNAKDKADEIVAHLVQKFGISVADKGRIFQLVSFASERDCRFFYPKRALKFHQQITSYLSRALRARFGLRIQRLEITVPGYHFATTMQKPAAFMGEDGSPSKSHARDYADSEMRFLADGE
jgi:hypothetical protein